MITIKDFVNKTLLLLIVISTLGPLALAANDPGHDILYVEQQGDSELNGTFNVTLNYTVKGGKANLLSNLVLYGTMGTPAPSPGTSYIGGTSTEMYIDAQDNIYIKFTSGGDMVYIGSGSPGTSLNISGALYLGNTLVCLANGTNCPSSLGGANITANGATAGYIPQFQSTNVLNNSIISQSENTLTINGNISMPTNFYIGTNAISNNTWTIAIGTNAKATGAYSIALGAGTIADQQSATAIGGSIVANATYTTAVGYNAEATQTEATALGYGAIASGSQATAIANGATASNDSSIAIGYYAQATGYESIALGPSAQATGYRGTALGIGTSATGLDTTAAGYSADATGPGAVALGVYANASSDYAIAIGDQSRATAQFSIAIGWQANATAQDAIAFGRGTINNIANSSKFGGAVYINGNINAATYNVSAINCIVFDSGGKICSGS